MNYLYNNQNYTLIDVVTQEYIDILSNNMMSLIGWFCGHACKFLHKNHNDKKLDFNMTLFDANLYEICKKSGYAKYDQYVSGGFDLMIYYDYLDLNLFNLSFSLKLVVSYF